MNDYLKTKELYHHGIKGQKWGVRRYQNEDGTLTEAGQARYNEDLSPKNPEKMSTQELTKANQRLQAESTYRNLRGTTQPGRALTRDNAIKIGATFVGTAGATFLLRKYKKGTFLDQGTDKKKALGKSIVTAMLAGSIGALLAGASSLGGSARPESEEKSKG